MSRATVQGELWGMQARDWAALQEPKHAAIWNAMLDSTGVQPGTRLADLGCGAGGASKLAAQLGADVFGIDASEAMIEIARQHVPDGEFRVGDLEDLPYGEDEFDVVIAANSIQFAGDASRAMSEIARTCRPGGRAAIAVWGMPEECGSRHVFEAVIAALPEKPPGGGPFALSMPGVLDDLVHDAGMLRTSEQLVRTEMTYPDLETAWQGTRSAGPLQAGIRAVGETAVQQAVLPVLETFQNPSGEICMVNQFRVLVASL